MSQRKAVTTSLSSTDRDRKILESLAELGQIRLAELAAELDVSEMTVRRDLDRLADQGSLKRVRGGAVSIGPEPFAQRRARNSHQKELIAAKLERLVGDGGAIALDASTTMQGLASRIVGAKNLTVVTNGPEAFFALQDRDGAVAVLTGGTLDPRTGGLVGPVAIRSMREIAPRRAFLSAAALHPELGSTEQTLEDADAKLALVEAAGSIVLAVDSSKLGARSAARCLPLDRVDVLVTELEPSDPRLDAFRDVCEIL